MRAEVSRRHDLNTPIQRGKITKIKYTFRCLEPGGHLMRCVLCGHTECKHSQVIIFICELSNDFFRIHGKRKWKISFNKYQVMRQGRPCGPIDSGSQSNDWGMSTSSSSRSALTNRKSTVSVS